MSREPTSPGDFPILNFDRLIHRQISLLTDYELRMG